MANLIKLVHVGGGIGERFNVSVAPSSTSRGTSLLGDVAGAMVTIGSPASLRFEAGPVSTAADGWQWYLEAYSARRLSGFEPRLRRLFGILRSWGEEALATVFSALSLPEGSSNAGDSPDTLEIHSADPSILAWPWEWLSPPGADDSGPRFILERRLITGIATTVHRRPATVEPLRVLMLSARKDIKDVDLRMLSLPLAELSNVELKLLRPPTLAALVAELSHSTWDVLHLDCHGWVGNPKGGPDDHHLLFETETGRTAPISAPMLVQALQGCAPPHIVLTACRSAMPLHEGDGSRSLAASLLQIERVVEITAMAFDVQISAAQAFIVSYYDYFTESRDAQLAFHLGRLALSSRNNEVGTSPSSDHDWMIPVFYRRAEDHFERPVHAGPAPFITRFRPRRFCGRFGEIILIERLINTNAKPIMIEGLQGQGKTALVKEILRWRQSTGDDRPVRSIDISDHAHRLAEFLADLTRPELAFVEEQVRQIGPFVLMVEHVEVLDGVPSAMLAKLREVFEGLHRRGCTVIGTGRSEAPWWGARGDRISLGGLAPESFADLIEREFEHLSEPNRFSRADLVGAAWLLAGHPAACRDLAKYYAELDPRRSVNPFQTGDWDGATESSGAIEGILREVPDADLAGFISTIEAAIRSADEVRISLGMFLIPDEGMIQLPETGLQILAQAFRAASTGSFSRGGLVYLGMPHPQLAGALVRVADVKLNWFWLVAVANRQKDLSVPRLTEEQIHAEGGPVGGEKRYEIASKRGEAIRLARNGEPEKARLLIKECIDFEESIEAPALAAMNLTVLGDIEGRLGDIGAADSAYAEAVHIFEVYDRRHDAGITCNQWARALANHGQLETAGELLIAAARFFEGEDDRMVAAAAHGFRWVVDQVDQRTGSRLEDLWGEYGFLPFNGEWVEELLSIDAGIGDPVRR